jgi:hypothetical protein
MVGNEGQYLVSSGGFEGVYEPCVVLLVDVVDVSIVGLSERTGKEADEGKIWLTVDRTGPGTGAACAI